MDKYQDVRSIPLGPVLASLEKRPGKKEHFGKCPFHQPKKNNTSFSFTNEKVQLLLVGSIGRAEKIFGIFTTLICWLLNSPAIKPLQRQSPSN